MRPRFARPFFSALAALLMGGALALAQGPGPGGVGPGFSNRRPPMERQFGRHLGRWWNAPHMISALKLTEQQRKKMDSILFNHREKLIELRANLEKAELNMQPLMGASEPNRQSIESQIDKIVAARGALEKANALFLLDIRMQLTPDQWQQLQTMRAQRGAGMHWRGRGPGGPPGGQPGPGAPGGQSGPPSPNPQSGSGPSQ